MPTQERQKVISAIDSLGRRVTVADVSSKTGLPVLVVASELNKIASDTGGHLEVATTGDVAYKFNLGFQTAYLAKGFQKFIQDGANLFFQAGFFLLRISFGIALILSLFIIVLAIIAVVLSVNRGNDREESSFNIDFLDFIIFRDILYSLLWWNYSPTYGYNQSTNRGTGLIRKKGNFLLNCFSFLFGDGDPNQDLEERRWQLIAQVIKENGGAITAEQIAPFTGNDPQNEDNVLPVLVRFDGRPQVSETGNIIYLFASLESTAAPNEKLTYGSTHDKGETRLLPGIDSTSLQERLWQFSSVSTDDLTPVIILSIVNLLGSYWLLSLALKSPLLFQHWLPLFICLAVYGSAFVAIPAVRWLVISWLNQKITIRNQIKQNYAQRLSNPTDSLLAKLQEAKQARPKLISIDKDNLVYTTERDELEQQFSSSQTMKPDKTS